MLVVCSALVPSSRCRVDARNWITRLASGAGIETLASSYVTDLAVLRTDGVTDDAEVERTEQLAQRERSRDDRLDSPPPRPQRLPIGLPVALAAHEAVGLFSRPVRNGQR